MLAFVRRFRREHGYSPTVRDVQRGFGWASVNAAATYLSALRRKGALVSEPGRSRTLVPVEARQPASLSLPYGGEVGP